jgi:hypothetical protein
MSGIGMKSENIVKRYVFIASLIGILAAAAFLVSALAKKEPVLAQQQDETKPAQQRNLLRDSLLARANAGSSQINTQKHAGITRIHFDDREITITGEGAAVSGSTVIILSEGTYAISGTLADGQVLVSTDKGAAVELIMEGATINCSNSSPLYIENAKNTKIVLADNSRNRLTDGAVYSANKTKKDEPNAALFSRDDLTISGNGSLEVTGNYDDGIASKDKLNIESGTILVNSADDGIRGKDHLHIKGGNVTVISKGDGLKADDRDAAADNTTPIAKGKITISGGKINITSKGDAIQASSLINIEGGDFSLTTGANAQYVGGAVSLKAIKSGDNLVISGGTFVISSSDDALHSNNALTVNGGTFDIATGNNGLLGNKILEINNADIRISTSYEGLEGAIVKINSGNIHINSSDDGISVRASRSRSGTGAGGRRWGDFGSGNSLYVNGGYIAVNAYGDGVDINGSIEMTGGTVLISGPINNQNGALDFGSFKITGGLLIAAGSSGMAQSPGGGSNQNSVMVYFDAYQAEGTLFHVQSSEGNEIVTFAPKKTYSSVAFSSPKLAVNTAYDVYYGGSSSGEAKDGLYEGGKYSPGTKLASFTPNSSGTYVGSGGMGFGGGFRGGRGRR